MPFFWIDLEMTGLDEKVDSILEVAVVMTDIDFKILEEYQRVVYQPPEVLEKMNDWCKKNHAATGLTTEVKEGTPLAQVEADLLQIMIKYFKPKDRIVLVGNSVGNDRRFIDKYMPTFAARLHYRLIDVSSFKEIFRDKYGVKFEKKNAHRALADIHESIRELQSYLSHVAPPNTSTQTHA